MKTNDDSDCTIDIGRIENKLSDGLVFGRESLANRVLSDIPSENAMEGQLRIMRGKRLIRRSRLDACTEPSVLEKCRTAPSQRSGRFYSHLRSRHKRRLVGS